MKTLLLHIDGPPILDLQVLLDVSPNDIEEVKGKLAELFKEARASNREIGHIRRGLGGDTYFAYDEATRAQLEISLIAAMVVPKSDAHVTQDAGGHDKWDRY